LLKGGGAEVLYQRQGLGALAGIGGTVKGKIIVNGRPKAYGVWDSLLNAIAYVVIAAVAVALVLGAIYLSDQIMGGANTPHDPDPNGQYP
jgi:hypothetical protein